MHVCLAASFALHGAIAVRIFMLVVGIVFGGFSSADSALPAIGFAVTFWTFHSFVF